MSISQAAARARSSGNLKPWKPGQSGNPGGRPKDSAKACREALHGSPELLVLRLLEIVNNDSGREKTSDRISAIRELWSRGWGLPASFTSIEGQDPLGLDEVAQEIREIADELERRRSERAA